MCGGYHMMRPASHSRKSLGFQSRMVARLSRTLEAACSLISAGVSLAWRDFRPTGITGAGDSLVVSGSLPPHATEGEAVASNGAGVPPG